MAVTFRWRGYGYNDLSSWTTLGGLESVDASIVHQTGARAIKVLNYGFAQKNGVCQDAGTRVTFWVYFDVLPAATMTFATVTSVAQGVQMSLQLLSTGILRLRDGNGDTHDGTHALSAGTWYRVSLAYTITSIVVNEFRLWLGGGSPEVTLSNIQTNIAGAGPVYFSFEQTHVGGTINYFTELQIDDSSALTDPGDVFAFHAKPNSTYVLDTGSAFYTGLLFACVLNQGSGNPTDLVSGASSTPNGSPAWTTLNNGDPGRDYVASGDADSFTTLDAVVAGSAMTLVAISDDVNGGKSGGNFAAKSDANNALYDFMFRPSGANNNLQLFYGTGSAITCNTSAVNKIFCGVAIDGTSSFWNIDGTTEVLAGVTLVTEAKRLVLGNRDLFDSALANGFAHGKLSALFWWNRKLSQADLATLQANPWTFLIPGGNTPIAASDTEPVALVEAAVPTAKFVVMEP